MPRNNRTSVLWVGSAIATLLIGLPVLAQESLLPPGFEAPKGGTPAPAPAPRATPAPRPAATTPAPRATTPTSAPRASAPAPTPSASPAAAPTPAFSPTPGADSGLAPGDEVINESDDGTVAADALPPPPPRYDLPPGSRRLLTRIGPLTPENGGLAPNAFGNRGLYLTALMDAVRKPIVSRWGHILLRRALLTAVDTPPTVNGADFAAARVNMLLRQGESRAAQILAQEVDVDRASARLRAATLDAAIANADPAMACPFAPGMTGQGDIRWDLTQAMCDAMKGDSGSAGAIIERVTRRGQVAAIDAKLADKVVGAGTNSRRSALVRWDGVDTLTPWRFGIATTTGAPIPDNLWRDADPVITLWGIQAPMIPAANRLAFASLAAETGVFSSRAYVDLVSLAAIDTDAGSGDAAAAAATDLRRAFVAASFTDRVAAVLALAPSGTGHYGGVILGARPAARIAPGDVTDDQGFGLLSAMFAGGYDNNAMAWAGKTRVGSQAWGLLAVGSPRPLAGVSAGQIADFADSDPTESKLRSRFLAAALIGLDRLSGDDAARAARDQSLALGTSTRWTRGIEEAADRGEAGTVAVLVAVGLQGRAGWSGVPPYHLYHITRALRRVGLGAEARMIAAEALTRA